MKNFSHFAGIYFFTACIIVSGLFAQDARGQAGVSWGRATAAAQWTGRYQHSALVFNNQMWVIGGAFPGNVYANDVWSSINGVTWTRQTVAAQWAGRYDYTSLVFNNQIWVMGGRDGNVAGGCTGNDFCNDVWFSADGISWIQATAAAPWSDRYGHTSLAFNGQMWIMGGYDLYPTGGCIAVFAGCNDVWSSINGVTWTRQTVAAQWAGRYGHTSLVFNSRMWVIGGYDGNLAGGCVGDPSCNDVWSSIDGVTWTQSTIAAQWSGRYVHTSLVFNNQMWVMGGNDSNIAGGCISSFVGCNDVWSSTNGVTWTRVTAEAQWQGRLYSTSLAFNNQMWVIGGVSLSGYINDVWFSPPRGAVRIQSPSGVIALPLFELTDPGLTKGSLRIQTSAGVRAFDIVPVGDPNASRVHIMTPSGVMAVRKE